MNEVPHDDLNRDSPDRIDELLIDRATVGLSEAEKAELKLMQLAHDLPDDESFDLTAASIDLAVWQDAREELPPHLKELAIRAANQAFREKPNDRPIGQSFATTDVAAEILSNLSRPGIVPTANQRMRRRELMGALAIAASLLVAVFGWWRPFRSQGSSGMGSSSIATAAQKREALVLSKPTDLIQIPWTNTNAEAQASGEVIWSDSKQQGFMTFQGLAKNDPSQEQYQLWIFDEERSEQYPVDGGVFDVADDSQQTVVEITAKLNVARATLFAVTIERPGGVVVSDRSRLPLIAKVNP